MVRASAPLIAGDIVAAEGTPVLREAFIAFDQAWAHRRVQDWLDTGPPADRIEATHRAARDERVRQQEHLAELTAERAWCEALSRISDLQRANLVSWANSGSRDPDTGKSVFQSVRLRRNCWTVPILHPGLGCFTEPSVPDREPGAWLVRRGDCR